MKTQYPGFLLWILFASELVNQILVVTINFCHLFLKVVFFINSHPARLSYFFCYINNEKHRKLYNLDYYCELFLPLYRVGDEEVEIDPINHRVYCVTTDSYPAVIHANGHAFRIFDKIYDQLFAEGELR